LGIATSRGLQRNFEALLNNFALDWLFEIEALAHAAGGLEDFIG
jgi:hypothetical protein